MTQETSALPVIPAMKPKWYARRWVVVGLACVLFLSGMLAGGAGAFAFVVSRARFAAKHPDDAHRKVLERMVNKLDLSPDQREKVQTVISRRQAAMRSMRTDFAPRVRKELETTSSQVQAELTPEQAKRWKMMLERMKTTWMPEHETLKPE
jgi:hypothetical protein